MMLLLKVADTMTAAQCIKLYCIASYNMHEYMRDEDYLGEIKIMAKI